MTIVMGIDGAAGGWLGIWLVNGAFGGSSFEPHVRDLLDHHLDAEVVAIDVPIGLPRASLRPADAEARRFVGRHRATSVFGTPPEEVLRAYTPEQAVTTARRLLRPGPTRIPSGLRDRILEVADISALDLRIIEVHPEVSFRALADAPLLYSTHTWNGLIERIELLVGAGIDLPRDLDGGDHAQPDSIVDAAIGAWSAQRFHNRRSATLPAVPPSDPALGGVIHY